MFSYPLTGLAAILAGLACGFDQITVGALKLNWLAIICAIGICIVSYKGRWQLSISLLLVHTAVVAVLVSAALLIMIFDPGLRHLQLAGLNTMNWIFMVFIFLVFSNALTGRVREVHLTLFFMAMAGASFYSFIANSDVALVIANFTGTGFNHGGRLGADADINNLNYRAMFAAVAAVSVLYFQHGLARIFLYSIFAAFVVGSFSRAASVVLIVGTVFYLLGMWFLADSRKGGSRSKSILLGVVAIAMLVTGLVVWSEKFDRFNFQNARVDKSIMSRVSAVEIGLTRSTFSNPVDTLVLLEKSDTPSENFFLWLYATYPLAGILAFFLIILGVLTIFGYNIPAALAVGPPSVLMALLDDPFVSLSLAIFIAFLAGVLHAHGGNDGGNDGGSGDSGTPEGARF